MEIIIIVIIYIKYNHFDCLIITFFFVCVCVSVAGQIPNHNSQLASRQLSATNQIPTIDSTLERSTRTVINEDGSGVVVGDNTTMRKEEMQIIELNGENKDKTNDDDDDGHVCKSKMRKMFNEWSPLLALLIIFCMLWMIMCSLLPASLTAPTAPFMRMAFLFIGAQLSGILITFIKLPDMLGMLFFGVLYTNVGLGDFSEIQGLEASLR